MSLREMSLREFYQIINNERKERTSIAPKLSFEASALAVDGRNGGRLRRDTARILREGGSQPSPYDHR